MLAASSTAATTAPTALSGSSIPPSRPARSARQRSSGIRRDRKDPKDPPDRKGHRVRKARKGLKAHKDRRESRACKVPKGDTGPAGSNHVYWASNSLEVEQEDDLIYHPIVGLSGLPAGWYVFATTIQSAILFGQGIVHDGDTANLQCITQLNGGDIQIGNVDTVRVFVPQTSNLSDTYVLDLPDNSSVIIGCRVYSGGSKALAVGHMTAFPVGQVN